MDTKIEQGILREHNTPLDFTQVQSWVRKYEVPFLESLDKYAVWENNHNEDIRKPIGFESFQKPHSKYSEWIPTGYSLCEQACGIWLEAIKNHFGQNAEVEVVKGNVKPLNDLLKFSKDDSHRKKFLHMWLRFKDIDGENYIIDPTFGQINAKVNRVIIAKEENEPDLYGEITEIKNITDQVKNINQGWKAVSSSYRDICDVFDSPEHN